MELRQRDWAGAIAVSAHPPADLFLCMTKEFGVVDIGREIVINCEAAVHIKNVDESSTSCLSKTETSSAG
jgi:hypothetical protein